MKARTNLIHELCSFESGKKSAATTTAMDSPLRLTVSGAEARFESGRSRLGLKLVRTGREGALRPVASPIISTSGPRLEMARNGMTEWYVNRGTGIEHGMVLDNRPEGNAPLVFSFRTSGDMTPVQDGSDILFKGDATLRYANIKAWDAQGTPLACSMSTSENGLEWRINDTGATYPVTIDPTVTFVKKITATTTSGGDDSELSARFGSSAALSDDLLFIGAKGKDVPADDAAGAVYILSRDQGGTDNWGVVKVLSAVKDDGSSDAVTGSCFGSSLSLSGEVLVVGAPEACMSTTCARRVGAVYIYSKDKGGTDNWGIVKKYAADEIDPLVSSSEEDIYFGFSTALSGDVLAVGSYDKYNAPGGNPRGAAYVLSRNRGGADNWGLVKKLTAVKEDGSDDSRNSGKFGYSTASDGNLVMVGSNGAEATDAAPSGGAVYIFSKNQGGSDNWGIFRKLTALKEDGSSDAANGADFGNNVFLSGDLLAVGSFGRTESGKMSAGAVYLYSKNQEGTDRWGILKKLTAKKTDGSDDTAASTRFGSSVSMNADLLAVGADHKDESGVANVGAVYVFSKDKGGTDNWGILKKLLAQTASGTDDPVRHEYFGHATALSTGDLAVAGPERTVSGKASAGAAYLFWVATRADSIDPADGATDVSRSRTFKVTFNHVMNTAGVEKALSFSPAASGDYSLSWDEHKRILSISPTTFWPASTKYTIDISTDAEDSRGGKIEEAFSASFTTGAAGTPVAGGALTPEEVSTLLTKNGLSNAAIAAMEADDGIVLLPAAQALTNNDAPCITGCSATERTEAQTQAGLLASAVPAPPNTFNAGQAVAVILGMVANCTGSTDSAPKIVAMYSAGFLAEGLNHFPTLFKISTLTNEMFNYTYVDALTADKIKAAAGNGGGWSLLDPATGAVIQPGDTLPPLSGGYTLVLFIKDNSRYDMNTALNTVEDPAVMTDPATDAAGTSGSAGCMLDPSAGFGAEWLLFLMVPFIAALRKQRR